MISMSGRFSALEPSKSSGLTMVVYFSFNKRDCRKIGSSRTGDSSNPVPNTIYKKNSLSATHGRTISSDRESCNGTRN